MGPALKMQNPSRTVGGAFPSGVNHIFGSSGPEQSSWRSVLPLIVLAARIAKVNTVRIAIAASTASVIGKCNQIFSRNSAAKLKNPQACAWGVVSFLEKRRSEEH